MILNSLKLVGHGEGVRMEEEGEGGNKDNFQISGLLNEDVIYGDRKY